MTTATRILTLTVAALVFAIGGLVGVRMLTARAGDAVEAAPTCTDKVIKAGQPIDSNVITVNVFNASSRAGLANRVRIDLQKNGFRGGQIGNSESAAKPRRVAILTSTPDDPRVALVAAQFRGKVEYAAPDIDVEDGIVVVVGDDYTRLRRETKTSTTSAVDTTVCVPVVVPPA